MQNVKNTIIDRIIGAVAPHLCYGCQKTGTLLCESCFYNITDEPMAGCIICHLPARAGICSGHHMPYVRAWHAAEREGIVQRMIGDFKFNNVFEAHVPLAQLLDATLPSLPPETIIVPVPTIATHIRQRGYDHMGLIANEFARMRGHSVGRLLRRGTQTSQRRARTHAERREWAAAAFELRDSVTVDTTIPYLVLDDVFTTGATVEYAARQLRAAGAQEAWVAVIARQPLD